MATKTELMVETIEQAIRLARAGEALTSVLGHLAPAIDTLARVAEFDEELRPEMREALSHLGQATLVLERSGALAYARFGAAHDRMTKEGLDA